MPATPSLSQLRAHLSALLPSKPVPRQRDHVDEVVVANGDAATLAETLDILSESGEGGDAQPEILTGTTPATRALPRR